MNPEVLHAVLIGVIFASAFLGLGGWVLRAAGLVRGDGDALRLSPVAIAIGFAGFSYIAYPLVGFATPHAAIILLVMLSGVVAGARYWGRLFKDARANVSDFIGQLLAPVPLVFLVLSVGCLLLASTHWFTPTSEGDALSGYMFNARWLYSRGLTYSPYNTVYNLYPFQTELVFSLAFAFGNDLIPKVLDGILGMFLLAGIYEFARRYADRLFSFFAAASMVVMNTFVTNWASGKVDILSTLTFFAGVSVLFLPREQWSKRRLAISAFLVGTACAQKYTVWVLALAYVIGLAVIMRGESPRRILRVMVGVSVVIFACLLPHFVKTVTWTGNPIAPFGRDLFSSTGVYLNPHDFSDATRTSLFELPLLPVKLFFDFELELWAGPFPWLILVGVPMIWVWGAPPDVRRLGAFAAVQLLLWIVVRGAEALHPRYLLAPTALLLVVAAVGVDRGSRRIPALKWTASAMIALSLAYLGIWQHRDWRRSWSFIFGREDRAAWHDRISPGRAFGAFQAIAPLLGPHRRLFLTASHYYVPEDKLPFINTERETAEWWSLPAGQRVDFLRQHCFGFLHLFNRVDNNPSWTTPLSIVAQRKDPAGLEYTIFTIDTLCDSSDTRAPCDPYSPGMLGRAHAYSLVSPARKSPAKAEASPAVVRSEPCP